MSALASKSRTRIQYYNGVPDTNLIFKYTKIKSIILKEIFLRVIQHYACVTIRKKNEPRYNNICNHTSLFSEQIFFTFL